MSFNSQVSRVGPLQTIAISCLFTLTLQAVEFQPPVRLTADGKPIEVESPGYAAPAWVDVDGDGKKDLVVGQFSSGKIHIFRGKADGKFAAGEFLQAGGKVAQVPGVW